MEEEFRCFCIVCGKAPELKTSELWVETEKGMLCEKCWREPVEEVIRKSLPVDKQRAGLMNEEFCCFCVLCGRAPPDPNSRLWLETERGCLCEGCWKEFVKEAVEEKIESLLVEKG